MFGVVVAGSTWEESGERLERVGLGRKGVARKGINVWPSGQCGAAEPGLQDLMGLGGLEWSLCKAGMRPG